MGLVLGLMAALLFVFRDTLPGLRTSEAPPEATHLLLPDPWPAAPLALFDPEGRPVTSDSLRGSVVALFFGYTNCPDVCPVTLARLGALQQRGVDGGPPLRVVFVSVDPDRDTPARLAEFVGSLPGDVLALSADEAEVRAQASVFGIMIQERTDPTLPEGEYLVDHTARSYLIDPDGLIVATIPPMASAAEIDEVVEAVYASLGINR